MPRNFENLEANGTLQDYRIFRTGNQSSVSEAAELRLGEASKLESPTFRLKCIGYFYGQSSSDDVRKWFENVEWYIRNHNLDYMAGKTPIHRKCTASQFRDLRQIWLEIIKKPDVQAPALANAGEFIGNRDFETAVILVKRAIDIDRENLEFYRLLRTIFMRESELYYGQTKENLLEATFEIGQCTLKIARSLENTAEFLDLQKLFTFALNNNCLDEANTFIQEIQEIVATRPYWRSTYYMKLGQILLKEGDLKNAKDCLRKVARRGIPRSMPLAQDLIEAGEGVFVAKCLKLMIKNDPEDSLIPVVNGWVVELLQGKSPSINFWPAGHLKVG